MAAYVQDPSFISRRAIVFVVIVAFHVLLIYGLANGLARRVVEVIAPPIQADISEKVEKRDEPPPPPPPQMERQQVEIPPPDINIEVPTEAPPTAITQVTTQHVVAPPVARPANRVGAKLDIKHSPRRRTSIRLLPAAQAKKASQRSTRASRPTARPVERRQLRRLPVSRDSMRQRPNGRPVHAGLPEPRMGKSSSPALSSLFDSSSPTE